MGSPTSSLLLCWLFILTLVQYSAAERAFRSLSDVGFEKAYNISYVVDNSHPWYDVSKGLSLKTNQKVLMKIDKQDGQSFQAEIGAFKNIYKKTKLENLLPFNIPNMLDFGTFREKRVIIFDSLGDDFMKLMQVGTYFDRKYYEVVCLWAKQMITALQFLHQQGYVHRDVRPENIAEGVENSHLNRNDVSFKKHAYLWNLGLALRYKSEDGTYKVRTRRGFNPPLTPFVSRQALRGYTQYPRDDIESLGYTMLRIAANDLPWAGFPKAEMLQAKERFFSGAVESVCRQMGISDMGMINVFRNFFELIRVKYLIYDFFEREIDYEDLSECFVYPARPVLYFGQLDQRMIDSIYENSKKSSKAIFREQYRIVRPEMILPDTKKGVMVKTATTHDAFVRSAIKVFKDLYSKSGQYNLLPVYIANMLGYGIYEGKRAIVLDSLGDDFGVLTGNNADNSPLYYQAVCLWANQMITALEFIHKQGYVHRDIKPQNIAEGVGDGTDISLQGFAYLFNFGHAVTYKYDNGTFKQQKQHPYTETASDRMSPFVSRAAMDWYTHYPRDDLEELGYTMLTVAAGVLPWYNYWLDYMLEAKKAFCGSDETVENVCKGMGMTDMGMTNAFINFFGVLRRKYFVEGGLREIDYEELRNCFAYPASKMVIRH